MSRAALDFNEPESLTTEEDAETLAAIDRGLRAADDSTSVAS
jgi:hypothetical protein